MHENLQRLAKELRAERCPRRVLENVQSQIEQRTSSRPWFGFRTAALAMSLALMLGALTFWRWPSRDVNRPVPEVVTAPADHVQVAQQAGVALGYIGTVLLKTGEHTESVLLNNAVPQLRNGLDAVSKTIKAKL